MMRSAICRPPFRFSPIIVLLVAIAAGVYLPTQPLPAAQPAVPDVGRLGVAGGLCVEIGCGDPDLAVQLVSSGRFLVQSLDRNEAAVASRQEAFKSIGLYGLASAIRLDSLQQLPYAENLVNLVLIGRGSPLPIDVKEVERVLCPGGVVLAVPGRVTPAQLAAAGLQSLPDDSSGGWVSARKPRPEAMDEWSHPWHGPDGNTVSQDRMVGPPRRVRWIAGPAEEISSMVTAEGRAYYGDVWARDAFNGLPLWRENVRPSPAQGGFSYRATQGSVRPIAAGNELVVLNGTAVQALDGATGKRLRSYPDAGQPRELLLVKSVLLAVNSQGIRALDVRTAKLLWQRDAAEPRYPVAAEDGVYFLAGNVRKGEKQVAMSLELASGKVRWQHDQHAWLSKVRRIVAHKTLVVFEVSTLADAKEGNAIHVASAADGKLLWSREYVPGMNHMKQSRAMFVGDDLWILEHLKCVKLDPQTGAVQQQYKAGLCHCFPPVATPRFMFTGEMDLTDLSTGAWDACQITKAHCSRDAGWIPANGLIYTSPKHCVCWPMLRGYVAMAPEGRTNHAAQGTDPRQFRLEKSLDAPQDAAEDLGDWPCYRHDAWRSGSTPAQLPNQLKPLWVANLGLMPAAGVATDWRDNPFVRGPVTAPVISGSTVCVARPDSHEVVAMDLKTGAVRWRFTADGRVDTPPTLHRGLCLFGTRSGSVYGLRTDDGRQVWRLRAAPCDEQIVAYGQVESPWPVPGSVLVIDGVAYFAAGRQPLADGGILLFAAEPATGQVRWVRKIDKLPMTNFYACVGLEFDNFDLLHQEGDRVAMSRWLFDRTSGEMVIQAKDAFSKISTGGGGVVVQRGVWTYAPRQVLRLDKTDLFPRPLAVFHGSTLAGCLQDYRTVYRRDFDAEAVEKFDTKWITGWAAGENLHKKKGDVWPVDRLAKQLKWSTPVIQGPANRRIAAMLLAGDRLAVAASEGPLTVLALDDGRVLSRTEIPAPLWDGMAAAPGRLLVSTDDGRVICLGAPQ